MVFCFCNYYCPPKGLNMVLCVLSKSYMHTPGINVGNSLGCIVATNYTTQSVDNRLQNRKSPPFFKQ